MSIEHVDVLIVGAGLSGIGAAWHLQAKCPTRSFAILEGRAELGGTWSLFRYPGIRSDSDMYTLGYSFRPWGGDKSIADGPSILQYLQGTAAQFGIDKSIRYRHRVTGASWSSQDARWSVWVERTGADGRPQAVTLSCNFLFMCSGYYRYAQGYTPEFPGIGDFHGQVVHPQQWPDALDCAGKRVVIIGSGATAVTLAPALAEQGAHVTVLQRSPSYVVARPSVDPVAARLKRCLPPGLASVVIRWKNVRLGRRVFRLCRRYPVQMKAWFIDQVRAALGPEFDVDQHFTPRYNPWEQRLCLVPDGDLFKAIRAGRVSMVTGQIERFTEEGITLASGEELCADLIVTATGLEMQMLGGIALSVDGAKVDLAETFTYKGLMYSGVPNLANSFGYINASWTLRSDLTCHYVCRLLNHMEKTGATRSTPRLAEPDMQARDWSDFSSGYIRRAQGKLAKQGTRKPWTLSQDYLSDLLAMKFGRVDDAEMEFAR